MLLSGTRINVTVARVFVRTSEVKATSNWPGVKCEAEAASIQSRAKAAVMCQAMCDPPKDQDRIHFCAPDNISKLQIISVPPGSQGGTVLGG